MTVAERISDRRRAAQFVTAFLRPPRSAQPALLQRSAATGIHEPPLLWANLRIVNAVLLTTSQYEQRKVKSVTEECDPHACAMGS